MIRFRRLRKEQWIRDLVCESSISSYDFIYPIFISEEITDQKPYTFKVYRTIDLPAILDKVSEMKIPVIALFHVCNKNLKDEIGSYAYNSKNEIYKAIKFIKKYYPDIGIMSDVALDPYTIHGHDGIIKDNYIDNDESIKYLCRQASLLIEAGSDIIAPSNMMDFRVKSLRELDQNIIIASYGAKYASSFYGPFRNTLGGSNVIDKSSYQIDIRNSNQAISEIENDIKQGADLIIVKPGMPYLDIIQRASHEFRTPIIAYQVSGEYFSIKTSIENKILQNSTWAESISCFKRAGAKAIITYGVFDFYNSLK